MKKPWTVALVGLTTDPQRIAYIEERPRFWRRKSAHREAMRRNRDPRLSESVVWIAQRGWSW